MATRRTARGGGLVRSGGRARRGLRGLGLLARASRAPCSGSGICGRQAGGHERARSCRRAGRGRQAGACRQAGPCGAVQGLRVSPVVSTRTPGAPCAPVVWPGRMAPLRMGPPCVARSWAVPGCGRGQPACSSSCCSSSCGLRSRASVTGCRRSAGAGSGGLRRQARAGTTAPPMRASGQSPVTEADTEQTVHRADTGRTVRRAPGLRPAHRGAPHRGGAPCEARPM
jgi:hypothetical protein